MIKNIILGLMFVFFITSIVRADIPPPSGFTRVKVPLVFETKEDLSNYRLFVDFAGIYEEVTVKAKGKTTFTTNGGGARFSGGRLIAVPKEALTQFVGKLTAEQTEELTKLIGGKTINGVIELGNHTFTVQTEKGKKVPTPVYVIKKEDDGLKLVRKTSKSNKKVALSDNNIDEVEQTEETVSSVSAQKAVAGIFLATSFLIGGLIFLRRKNK